MTGKDKVKFLITDYKAKSIVICDTAGQMRMQYHESSSEELQTRVTKYLGAFGSGTLVFYFKTSKNQDQENSPSEKISFEGVSSEVTVVQQEVVAKPLDWRYDPKARAEMQIEMDSRLAFVVEQKLLAKDQAELKEEKDRLQTIGGKLGMAFEPVITPYIDKLNSPLKTVMQGEAAAQNITPNGTTTVMANKQESLSDLGFTSGNTSKDNSEKDAEGLKKVSPEDKIKFQKAVDIFVNYVKADDLLQMAEYIKKKPEVIPQLMLFVLNFEIEVKDYGGLG